MLRTRDDVYQPGLPARAGEHYGAFVRFAAKHAGQRILDLGCGYGAYSLALLKEGRSCVGCDVNLQYLKKAAASGLPAVAAEGALPFSDKSFDTVLLFEVIEHVPPIEAILKEAFRVARKNVLVTVPNAQDLELLKGNDVTYAHMLSSDHVHFFDPDGLSQLLGGFGSNVHVDRGDPILPFWFLSRSGGYYALRALYRAGLMRPRFFSRLYAVASVR
ncbi:MAG TPA: class I SAM-dependent methyltransferase [Terriglobia bacterium]|nr:class I SAM-dependent methyltransferase [Terriglobia bacterium]